jgi:endonuclease-8
VRAYEQKGKTIFYDDLMLKKLDKTVKNRRFMVFARKGQDCYICKDIILKDQVSSRRIYYCPKCQKA